MKNWNLGIAALLLFALSSFTTADNTPVAASDYLLEIDGIKGESSLGPRRGLIDIESYTMNRETKSLTVVRRSSSKSSPMLQLFCASGTHIKKAVLFVRKSGGEGYMKIELENVLITSYQTSTSDSGLPTESFSLNYEKARF